MNTAQLMTTTETTPLVTVFENVTVWGVCVGDDYAGDVTEYHTTMLGPRFSVPLKDGNGTRQFHTRNDAVQWILAQHKVSE